MDQNYNQFKKIFITECNELIADMESLLLELDIENPSIDDLNAIFRCAHSIKGGAGAFNLNAIIEFTHILETLLDRLRDSKIKPTKEMVDCLLKSADIMAKMVDAANKEEQIDQEFGRIVAEELKSFLNEQTNTPINSSEVKKIEQDPIYTVERKFIIKFIPSEDLFLSGNDPIILIRALSDMGIVSITPIIDKIPEFEKLSPENCYIAWEIDIETKKEKKDIEEVFEFVSDISKLEISLISEFDVKDNEKKPKETAVVEAKQETVAEKSDNNKNDINTKKTEAKQANSIRVDIDKVDRLVNMVGELVITQSMLYAQVKKLPQDICAGILRSIEDLSQHSREVQEAVMSVRMQPVKSIFSRMPRLVRDLCTQLGKDIKLEMQGEQTEIDKTVIEQLGDPLTHMIRNSADHGVEKPQDRISKGKSAQGTITLSASHRGGKIIIDVSDDGAGINREKVLSKAIEKGLFPKDVNLSPEEIDKIIFMPGFSTADAVTNISGRGVGMDVVKRNIESLGGSIMIKNDFGKGASFTVSLPLTLAILDGMIIRVSVETYIIPINNIIETLQAKKSDLKEVSKGSYVLDIRGEFLPIYHLSTIFTIKTEEFGDEQNILVVVVDTGKEKYGIIVNELLGQQQVVIKSLEENTDPIEGISGATILGDGKVSLILDIAKIPMLYQKLLISINPKPIVKIKVIEEN